MFRVSAVGRQPPAASATRATAPSLQWSQPLSSRCKPIKPDAGRSYFGDLRALTVQVLSTLRWGVARTRVVPSGSTDQSSQVCRRAPKMLRISGGTVVWPREMMVDSANLAPPDPPPRERPMGAPNAGAPEGCMGCIPLGVEARACYASAFGNSIVLPPPILGNFILRLATLFSWTN